MNESRAAKTTRPDLRAQARQVLLTALLLGVVAGLLRFMRLGAWSMWSDEVATLRDALNLMRLGPGSMWSGEVTALRDALNLSSVVTFPIGYVLIGWFVQLFGDGELAARFLPALVGTLSPPVIYLAGRRLFSERAGVIAAALLALSSYHIFFSQYARYYTLVMLLGFGGMWCGYLAIEFNRRRDAALSVALLALAVLTHWSALLLVPGLALFALLRLRGTFSWRRNGATLAILFGPMLLGLVVAAPMFVRFLSLWGPGEGFSAARFGLIWLKIADRIELPVLLCALAGGWMLWRLRDPRLAWLAAFAGAPVILTTLFVGFSEGGSRFALTALPPFLLLAGYLLDQFIELTRDRARAVAWVLLALTLSAAGVRDLFYFTVERGQRPRWKEAAAYVVSKAEPGARIIAAAPEVFDYCARRLGSGMRAEAAPIPCGGSFNPSQGLLPPPRAPEKPGPLYIITEQVANMAPTEAQQRWLDAHATLEKRFPLNVRFLDYSIVVYRVETGG